MKRLAKKLLALILVIGLAFPVSGVSVQAEETVENIEPSMAATASWDAHKWTDMTGNIDFICGHVADDLVTTDEQKNFAYGIDDNGYWTISPRGIISYKNVDLSNIESITLESEAPDLIWIGTLREDFAITGVDGDKVRCDETITYQDNTYRYIRSWKPFAGTDVPSWDKDESGKVFTVPEEARTADSSFAIYYENKSNPKKIQGLTFNVIGSGTPDDDTPGEEPTTSWTIEGNTVNVQRGQKATVVFDVKESTLANVRAARIQVAYDDAVLSISDESAVVLGNMLKANGNATADVNINYSEAGDSCISVACVSTEDVLSGTGTLLSITFDVKENAAIGESSVSLTVVELLGDDTDAISTTTNVVEGKVTVAPPVEFTPGDVDNNGAVELEDALTSLKIAVGSLSVEAGSVGFWAADMDGNGSITVEDVLQILKMANGKTV